MACTQQHSQESIYSLLPKVHREQEKPPRYVSKANEAVKAESKSNRYDSKTMGPAKVKTNPTTQFLKKHEKEPQLPEKQGFHYPDEDRKRPAIPKPEEKPLMGLKTTKNFITQNAVENIMSVAKKPEKSYADTRIGDKHPLEPSGLDQKFIHKKDYGEVPGYLVKRKDETEKAQAEYEAYVKEGMRRGAMQCLPGEERQMMLDGLKKNWEQLHHEYQGLSVVTDTAPKKNRKERMEAEMKQLERDIELVEKHKVIYVAK